MTKARISNACLIFHLSEIHIFPYDKTNFWKNDRGS